MAIKQTLVCDDCGRIIHSEKTAIRARFEAGRKGLYRRFQRGKKLYDVCSVCAPTVPSPTGKEAGT